MDGYFVTRASKKMAKMTALAALAIGSILPNHSIAAGVWTNEPAGANVLLDCGFSTNICSMFSVYGNQPLANDSTAPASPSGVLDEALEAGESTGGAQLVFEIQAALGNTAREMYIGMYWKTNPQFQGLYVNTNKMFFLRNASIDNNFMSWHGLQDQPRQLVWYNQARYDNCHVSGWVGGCYNQGDGTGWFLPNINGSAATISAGSGWHKIEVYQKASTTATSRDGILRWWVDNILVGQYTNINLCPAGFQDFQFNHTWDGSAALNPPNRDMSRAWHHYFDHLHISVGSTSKSIDQPAGPPATPTLRSVVTP